MQEGQDVTFQPEFVWAHPPMYVGLFRLYLLLVSSWAIIRFAWLLWAFRRQRIARQDESLAGFSDIWELSSIKTRSLKALSQLTLLVALIVLAWTLSDDLTLIYVQKTSGVRAITGAFADALNTFCLGAIVSTGLFCCAAFCEHLIHRQRLGITRAGNKAQPAPPNNVR